MGVYIKGMEMPASCGTCWFCNDESFGAYKCERAKKWGSENNRAEDCPLIEVPDGHGRLIDADEFRETFEMDDITTALEVIHVRDILSEVPAIIPAEPPKEE